MSVSTSPVTGDPALCSIHKPPVETALSPHVQVLVLAGNPNVGKSVIFNALTGLYTNVSNFPGTTVDIPKGKVSPTQILLDSPGVYGLTHLTEEEQVAENAILNADIVINVVSAISLERDLFLTQHILDYQKPTIVVLNQMDEARSRGVNIDTAQLELLLGVPVLTCVATQQEGTANILPMVPHAKVGNPMMDCPDPETLKTLEENPLERTRIYGHRRQYVNAIVQRVQTQLDTSGNASFPWSKQLGTLFLNPVIGVLSGLIVLALLYQVVGIWVAGDLVNFTENTLMLGWVVPLIENAVSTIAPKGSLLFTLLAGEFGVLTMSLQYIFGVLFPLILGFYIYISILEDCGYLPRIAVLCDGLLNKIGLNGRAVIPIIIGFGCVTMATISTRVLNSQRERTIASTILAITIPCSAQIAVLVALMGVAGGLKAWGVFIGILFIVLVALGTMLNKLIPGKSTSLLLDLPPMRMPNAKNIVKKTWVRTVAFIKEATPLFILGSLLVSVAQVTGFLTWFENMITPLTVNWLNLPAQTASVFIMGMVRRDFGAAGLYFLADQLTAAQILTALITITLFVPCIASYVVICKERGWLESAVVLVASWGIAFLIGGIVGHTIPLLGIL